MSISDLEWLLTWAERESPADVLRDKLSDSNLDDMLFSQYLRRRADSKGLSFPRRILKDKADAFFEDLIDRDIKVTSESLSELPKSH